MIETNEIAKISHKGLGEADPIIDPTAKIGASTKIWYWSQIRENAIVGSHCQIGKNVYIDKNVRIGNRVKIQNNVSIYNGVTVSDGVFIGPHVCFSNDLHPRSITILGDLKTESDWTVTPTFIDYGASIGANATIICGVKIGRWALVVAGSVVTKDVPDYGLIVGNPAQLIGHVCICGRKATIQEGQVYSCLNKCHQKHPDFTSHARAQEHAPDGSAVAIEFNSTSKDV